MSSMQMLGLSGLWTWKGGYMLIKVSFYFCLFRGPESLAKGLEFAVSLTLIGKLLGLFFEAGTWL
jgi:hypothetical protein